MTFGVGLDVLGAGSVRASSLEPRASIDGTLARSWAWRRSERDGPPGLLACSRARHRYVHPRSVRCEDQMRNESVENAPLPKRVRARRSKGRGDMVGKRTCFPSIDLPGQGQGSPALQCRGLQPRRGGGVLPRPLRRGDRDYSAHC